MICTSEDSYVRELQFDRGQAVWVAELSSGLLVYQDDHRPGVGHHSAWVRLGEHVRAKHERIVRLGLKFRSNKHPNILPLRADGYFFCRSVLGVFGGPDMLHFHMVGALTYGQVMIKKFKVPELTCVEILSRNVEEVSPLCLIRS